MEGFSARVIEVVARTRPGDVVTYGEVAAEAGNAAAARAVGRVLRGQGDALPWWRVVTSEGRLVPGLEREHARRLALEGVRCRGGEVTARASGQVAAGTGRSPG